MSVHVFTVSLACSEIRLMRESFTTFSDEEINAVTAEEFTECLSDIGQLTMWNDSQKIVLLEKAVNVSLLSLSYKRLIQIIKPFHHTAYLLQRRLKHIGRSMNIVYN